MKLIPIAASKWVTSNLSEHNSIIINDTCIFPCNEVFFPLWNERSDVLLIYGGFGSGKSVFTVAKLLNHLLNDDYFRLYYGRKVHDTIRASCFDTICDTIEDLGLQPYFNYKRSSNSSMEITTKHNKNFMRTFTIDDPSKAKSIKDPSHIWMEEADQFTDKDFGLLLSRLRTKKVVNTQLILTTNTERMSNNHWIVTQLLNNSKKI